MIKNLEKWGQENGYAMVSKRDKEGEQVVCLLHNPFNTQIIVGEEFSVNERYTYEDRVKATIAYLMWLRDRFDGEPKGWIRHQPSNRRRENGDPEKETIRE